MRLYPALDVTGVDSDLLLALVDDFRPTAVEERVAPAGAVRVFFPSQPARDAALAHVRAAQPDATASEVDVPDEDWARRSQENLKPVTVGRITISPRALPDPPDPPGLRVVIAPSMGFGTGHHATTRLCLQALQRLDLRNRFVLDVGTGSGVLAIAARLLGAAGALGIDNDPDAIQSANENLALNPGVNRVTFRALALEDALGPAGQTSGGMPAAADVITANLTGALLMRAAPALSRSVTAGNVLVLSGILCSERDAVLGAFGSSEVVWEAEEDGWAGLTLRVP